MVTDDLAPTAQELLSELADAFEAYSERHADEVTVSMVYDQVRAKGIKASRENVRTRLKARVDAGELVERKVGTHSYYSKPKGKQ